MEVALADFDLNALHELSVGDVIEVPTLMPGLDEETVVGMVVEHGAKLIKFSFSYYGVWIGTYILNKEDNKWSKVSSGLRT